jgi:hypothetical protein
MVDGGAVKAGEVAASQEHATDGVGGGEGGKVGASVESGAVEADVDWEDT